MTRPLIFALSLCIATPAYARVRARASTLCHALLGAVEAKDVVAPPDTRAAWTKPRTVVHLVRSGEADVAKFFADIEAARRGITMDAMVQSSAIPPGARGWRTKVFREQMYMYGFAYAGFGIHAPLIAIPAVGTIPNGPWGAALAISVASVGAGLLGYPIRFVASIDLGYPKLRRAARTFRAGRATEFTWRHRVRVIDRVALKVAHGQRLDVEDLHAQNLSEEAAGVWRRWAKWARRPNYFANLTVRGSRDGEGTPTVEMDIELVPEFDGILTGGSVSNEPRRTAETSPALRDELVQYKE